jgi:hypothetical protein
MFTSYAATATGPVAGPVDAGAGNTHRQFTLKVLSSTPDVSVALETSPDGTTWTQQSIAQKGRSAWGYARGDLAARFARVNVLSLGTGTPPVAAVIGYY